ncbi:hypothetical protein B0E38_03365 [Streptomyces sp. 111WW2]|nr:hypothetical protein B0E38_03365 [Streptomyces sp. 111WW2]
MTGMDAGSPSSGMRHRTSGRADERTDQQAAGRGAGPTAERADRHTGIRAYRHRGMRAGTPPGASAPRHRPRHPGAHRRSGTDHAATPLNGWHQPPAHALPRHPQGPPGRGAGPRSHAGPPRGHRGRHPNGPAADTHRARGGGRSAARGGCAAADSGIPAAAPPAAPGAGGRRAPGHDRRLPRLPVTTLHQPSDRQGPRSRSGFPSTITPPRERRPPRRGMRRGGRLADGPSARCGCHQLLERSHAVRAVTRPFTVGCLYTFTELLSAECGRGLFGQYVPHQRSARLLRAHAHFVHDRPPSLDAADTLQETPVRPRPVAFGVHSGDGHFGRPRRTHTRRAANDQPTGPARVAV